MAHAAPARHAFIDWLRGVAVLLMIQTHLYDAWVHKGAKLTEAYAFTRHIGGIPARLFLFLVGVSMALRFEAQMARGAPAAAMRAGVVRRGAEVLLLAYLFRFTEYVLGGAWSTPYVQLARVDILNCIGISMIVVGLLAAPRAGRPAWVVALLLAAFFLGLGPVVGPAHFPAWLPEPLTAYLGGQRPIAWFSMFPWTAWVALGLAVGHLWLRSLARWPQRGDRLFLATAFAGAALIGAVTWVRGHLPYLIRYPNDLVATMGPGSFFYRLGYCLLLAALAWLVTTRTRRGRAWIELLGQTSLFVYWIHVELCYGNLSKPFHGALDMRQATLGLAGMIALMVVLSSWRTRRFDPWWKARRAAKPAPAIHDPGRHGPPHDKQQLAR